MELVKTFSSISRFHDVAFFEKDGKEVLLVACDDGKIRIYQNLEGQAVEIENINAEKTEHIAELVGFTNRYAKIGYLYPNR